MKKHGIRMEWVGGIGLFLLAMASDAGKTSVSQTLGWGLLCTGILLLGYRFTLPRKRRARTAAPAARTVVSTHTPVPAPVVRPAA